MSSAAGFSRQCVAQTSSSYNDDDDDNHKRRQSPLPSSPSHSPHNGSTSPAALHAGSAFEGGSKIAYDPRDLAQEVTDEARLGGKILRLTLMDKVLLLGLKDKLGYLSFWNDNISCTLRGCILIELALRHRVASRQGPQPATGKIILNEVRKLMKMQQETEKLSVNSWVDLLSDETWNVMKIGFQLKQVRECLAKGLVDKRVLRTEKRNFLLFDMATHPVAGVRTKESIITLVVSPLTSTISAVPASALDIEGVQCRTVRAVCLVCTAHTTSVLDNAFGRLDYKARELAFQRCDEILGEFMVWPLGSRSTDSGTPRKRSGLGLQ